MVFVSERIINYFCSRYNQVNIVLKPMPDGI